MPDFELRRIYQMLTPDKWRQANAFSSDIKLGNMVLHDPYAEWGEKEEHTNNWLQGKGNQPCLFGRIAAATNYLHYCFISEEDILTKNDEEISIIIKRELLNWRRRCLRPDISSPAHGFILSVSSRRLAEAAPNALLYDFSNKLLALWGCTSTDEMHGEVFWEELYLRNPVDEAYVKFKFSVDFFAAQGDGRWWHDHRSPGGLLFTANSVGHMLKTREWYFGRQNNSTEWLVRTAMQTIAAAAPTSFGKATWLREVDAQGRPLVSSVRCPFSSADKLPAELEGKDWTKYGGFLHTDHSIRKEFFKDSPAKSHDIAKREFLEDFTYLYDATTKDHLRFVQGERVSLEEVVERIGSIETWFQTTPPRRRAKAHLAPSQDLRQAIDQGRHLWRQ